MNYYQKFLRKGIELASLGVERHTNNIPHFCTPKGASFIGWAGVDGIHFCFIRGFGEMVFAVSPMNAAPEYVHPLARDFGDFLRLLLACGDSAALEQAWQWSEVQFGEFLALNPPTEEQKSVMMRIADEMKLNPMEHPWQYMKQLREAFDDSKIKYTEDYYDIDMNPGLVREKREWQVRFDGGFWNGNLRSRSREKAGKEISLMKPFVWAGRQWMIPAVYLCTKGMVVDFCMQREQDDPFAGDFEVEVSVNGKELKSTHGYGTVYDPCRPDGCVIEMEAKDVVEHYGLDADCGWMIWRCSYPWVTKRKPEIKAMSVTMKAQKASIPGPRFQVDKPGDTVSFTYPEKGTEYTLTVQEYEQQRMDMGHMRNMMRENMEYPEHYHIMTYTIEPEIPDGMMTIRDCSDGDRPREKERDPYRPVSASSVFVVGIIGGASGPTVMIHGADKKAKLRAACSSLHFEPVENVKWQMVFHEKQYSDMRFDIENCLK